jgi:two-component sensor histidine kinase
MPGGGVSYAHATTCSQYKAKRLEDEQKFRELAVEELAHRLKNKVATIQSIVSLRLREDPQARDEIVNCLGSLRATDDLIIAAQGKGARIADILSAELRPYDVARRSIEGPEIFLPPKLALTMALLFHELATNAAKYGALPIRSVKYQSVGHTLILGSTSNGVKAAGRQSPRQIIAVSGHGYSYGRSSNLVAKQRPCLPQQDWSAG